jgi:acyl-CoA reductase-like NAD-dependent aldehyde dehydrogenase
MGSPTNTDTDTNDTNGTNNTDTTATVDAVVEIVSSKAKEWAELPIERKIKLLEELLENAIEYKDEWVSCQEKKLGIDPKNPLHGYAHFDVMAKGPATFGGYANGILTSLKHSKKHATPPKPTYTRRVGNKTIATVWPSRFNVLEYFEAFGMTAEMVCHHDGGDEPLQQTQEESIQEHYRTNRCAAILGPGNFDAPTDLLCELFIKGRVCVYKPNPINDASVNVLKKILEPLIKLGYVAFVPETVPAAKALVQHDQVQEIVLTGSQQTLNKIKWGNTLEEQERNQQKNTPINPTPVCAELGAVTPWIIVPGPQWTKRSVDKHARALAFAKMANNGHICVSPQVVVLPKDWKHRAYFWERTRYWLSQHPGSVPYYPGSDESHKHFQKHPNAELIEAAREDSKAVFPGQQRPVLISNTSIDNEHDQQLFQREAWCPVLMELPIEIPRNAIDAAIDAAKSDTGTDTDTDMDPMAYLKHAIHVSQSNLYGSLSIAILINDKTIRNSKGEFDDIVVNHLQYGLVGINIWPCYGNNMSQLRWGAFYGNSASGTGSLGNANLYRHTEKTILRAPFLHLPRRTLEVMKPQKVSLLFSRFTTYKLKPTLWTQLGLFAALFLGV